MTSSARVLVADRHRLDSELIAACIKRDVPASACTPDTLMEMDLDGVDLVLMDAEAEERTFLTVSGCTLVGLLHDAVSPSVRVRSALANVRMTASRSSSPEELLTTVKDVLRGADRTAVLVQAERRSGPVLSRREHEVLNLLARGLGNRDIAEELAISPHTARTHVQSLFAKLDRGNRVSAVGAARAAGLLPT
jgi:DNA-binding NarL/FixJ family response regulator